MPRPGSTFVRSMIVAPVAAAALAAGEARAARIECTQAAFEQAIAEANSGGGNVVITFNCSNAVIRLDSGRDSNRLITASNVTIDGENRNLVFEQNPPWWDDSLTACGGGNCDPDGNGVPDLCAETEGASMFLNIQGSDVTVRNLAFNYFWDGIHLGRNGGSRQTLENVSCDNPGDDCVSNPTNTGHSLVIRNSRFSNACDKAVQLYGTSIAGNSNTHVTVEGSTFTNCSAPLRAPYAGGRYRIAGNTIRESNPSGMYYCDGPRFNGTDSVLYFTDNTVDGCRRGLRVGGSVQLLSSGNTYRGNDLRGLAVYDTARASIERDTYERNGGSTSSETWYGGVSVAATATADLGGGSLTIDGQARTSAGNNVFLGNRSASDATLDVQNQSATQLRAENNWWGDLDPSDQVSGPVDFSPFLSGPPSGGNDPDPPAGVQNVRRTDRRN